MTTSAHSEFLAFAALSAAFVVKQFLADFPLQSNWMARGKERANGYLVPLFAHASVHGVMSGLIALFFLPSLWWVGGVDFLIHFATDLGKSSIGRRAKWTPADVAFWILFGFDQLVHHLTGLGIAFTLAVA
jgi:Protein of unknown function (DUF3307)